MSLLGVIPARGGSKRIPGKNIRPFEGVPLLMRAATVARESGVFARIIVSTDDDAIADVALSAGCEVPFRRRAELADDHTGTATVIADAIRNVEETGDRHDVVCCIYPAAVLVRPQDYVNAYRDLVESGAEFVFSATEFAYPIWRALQIAEDGRCEMIWPEYLQTRSQDLATTYHDAGQFYFGTREAWLAERHPFSRGGRVYRLPRTRVQDIDTEEDWILAETLYRLMHEQP